METGTIVTWLYGIVIGALVLSFAWWPDVRVKSVAEQRREAREAREAAVWEQLRRQRQPQVQRQGDDDSDGAGDNDSGKDDGDDSALASATTLRNRFQRRNNTGTNENTSNDSKHNRTMTTLVPTLGPSLIPTPVHVPSALASRFSPLELGQIMRLIHASLDEDVGTGDVTTLSTIAPSNRSVAKFLAKEDGVVSGLHVAELVFYTVDPSLVVKWTVRDGDHVKRGTHFGTVTGSTRSLLLAERLSLNLMQRMSGVATQTARMVEQIASVPGSATRILDTRKTVPGLRAVDKMAVRHGGALNHRIGLYDMVMIKDNHVMAAGGVRAAVDAVRRHLREMAAKEEAKDSGATAASLPAIELETRTLDEVREALEIGHAEQPYVQRLMLDNMVVATYTPTGALQGVDISMLEQALALIRAREEEEQEQHKQLADASSLPPPRYETEASGNVTLETVAAIAKTNVSFISTGSITHSVKAMDISLKIQQQSA